MARVSDAELDRLKREVSLERLAEARGVELKRHGANLIGLCPFHDDHEPSLVITPSKNLWNCLGACRTGGSVVDWVVKAEGVSFRHAVELLRSDLPTVAQAPAGGPPPKTSTVRKLPPPVESDADDSELLTQVVGYYHDTLKESPDALEYLQSRGLNHSEMIGHCKLGFANRTLGYRLPQKNRKEGQDIRERLQKLGILRESGHEHFNGSIVIPVFDADGRVAEVYGRKITPNLRKGTPLHLYLPGPHRSVWNMQAVALSGEIILCESLIDALTFWCAGFRNVTTSYGINGFTADHLESFKEHGTERVLIAYDRDDAGDKAAVALADQLTAEGLECFRIQFPRGMDANEYALKVQPATKSLELLIRKAQWLGNGEKPLSVVRAPLSVKSEKQATKVEEDGGGHASSFVAGFSPSEASLPPPEESRPAEDAEQSTWSPMPPSPPPDVPVEVGFAEVVITLGDRRYRVRGLRKNMSYDVLKVNLLVSCGEAFHVDTLNLYSARQRGIFVHQAATELAAKEAMIQKDLGKVLLKLEELQDEQIRKALEPKDEAISLSDKEKAEALAFLRDPNLLARINADFEACGLVGEAVNRQVGYLTAVSRKLEKPLAIIIQSSSAAGKSALMDAVLALMPEEEKVQYSAMTGQSLFYMGETDLKHKILAIAEEEGAEKASYALKLLQSEGKLSIASTGKDSATGKLVTHEYIVEGPVAIILTTTAIDIDEELLNRCIVLTVDEGREQTRAIHRMQRRRRTLEGLVAHQERSHLLKLHQNAQRLLRPLAVLNPYADCLTFLDDTTRTRRDHEKYLTLIDSVALLHQYQREVRTKNISGAKVRYVEATLDDIAFANKIAGVVLGRTLDELPPQTRRLLLLIEEMVQRACEKLEIERMDYRFTRRAVREHSGFSLTQLRVHLHRLVEMEYLITHRGGRGQSFVYELLYDGQGKDGKPFLPGLIDVEKLRDKPTVHPYDSNLAGSAEELAGSEANRKGPKRAQNAPKTVAGRDGEGTVVIDDSVDSTEEASENAPMPLAVNRSSYPQPRHSSMTMSAAEAD